MTVMTMKELVQFVESVKESPNTEEIEERVGQIDQAIESLAEISVAARDIILKRMTEEELVKFMNSISKITVFSAAAFKGGGMGLMIAMMSGDLQGYTHSVILAAIGALINEEIL